jgi:hypothetical protein
MTGSGSHLAVSAFFPTFPHPLPMLVFQIPIIVLTLILTAMEFKEPHFEKRK